MANLFLSNSGLLSRFCLIWTARARINSAEDFFEELFFVNETPAVMLKLLSGVLKFRMGGCGVTVGIVESGVEKSNSVAGVDALELGVLVKVVTGSLWLVAGVVVWGIVAGVCACTV